MIGFLDLKRSIKTSALQTLLTLAGVLAAAGGAQAAADSTRVIVAMKRGATAGDRAAMAAAKGQVKLEVSGTSAVAFRATKFGLGQVRAKSADDRIKALGCSNSGFAPLRWPALTLRRNRGIIRLVT